MSVTIEEGPPAHLLWIHLEGATLAESELSEALSLPTGKPFSSVMGTEAVARVRALYLSRGYADVRIRPDLVVEGSDLGLVLRIREGERRAIGSVTISGNTRTQDWLIRRALEHIPAERLVVCSDCGMGREGMSRRHAFYKTVSIVLGTNIVRGELDVPQAECLAADERYTPTPAPDDATVRARYGLPERYALYLGGFDVRKNVATVIGTYRWAGPVIGEDCPLVIAGRMPGQDTSFTPDPRRLAQEQGVGQFVRFIDFPPEADKPAIYRGAVAFVFPSWYEGFGLPPLEALACGTPVVGSDVSSIPEVVGNAGVLLPPDDAEGMAGALIQLATDEEFYTELSRRALAQAAQFSWERAARETLAAYRGAMG